MWNANTLKSHFQWDIKPLWSKQSPFTIHLYYYRNTSYYQILWPKSVGSINKIKGLALNKVWLWHLWEFSPREMTYMQLTEYYIHLQSRIHLRYNYEAGEVFYFETFHLILDNFSILIFYQTPNAPWSILQKKPKSRVILTTVLSHPLNSYNNCPVTNLYIFMSFFQS